MNIQPPKNLTLPKLTKEQKLPIVLSFDETRDILTKTKDLREKTILAMLYSCGLRKVSCGIYASRMSISLVIWCISSKR